MADDWRKAQFEAFYGPLSEFEIYDKKHGRKKNKMERKYAVEHRVREMMRQLPRDRTYGGYGGSDLSAEEPLPQFDGHPTATPSPTDAPSIGDPGPARMFRETTAENSFNPTNVDGVGNYRESLNGRKPTGDDNYTRRLRAMRETINSYQSGTVPDDQPDFESMMRGYKAPNFEVERGLLAGPAFGAVIDSVGPSMFQLRYGMSPEEKMEFESSGAVPGVTPETMHSDPTGSMRATSAFLGGRKWGELPTNAFQRARNLAKFYGAVLTGESPFGYSAEGEEAPGWDLRMDKIVRDSARQGAAEGRGQRRRRTPGVTSIRG